MRHLSILNVMITSILSLFLGTKTALPSDGIHLSYIEKYMVDSILYTLLPDNGNGPLTANVVWGYPHNGHISIPDTVCIEDTSYPVTGISISAFKGGDIIRSISLPYTMKWIEPYVFQGTGIDSISIPMNAYVRDACFDGSNIRIVKFIDNPYQDSKSCFIGSNCFNIHEFDRIEVDSCDMLTLSDTGGFIKQLWLKGVNKISFYSNQYNMFCYYGHLRSVRIDSPNPPEITNLEETEISAEGLRRIILFVPDKSVEAYKSSDFWKFFYDVYPVSRINELDELITEAASISHIFRDNEINVRTEGNNLILSNLKGETFEIYNMSGQIIATITGKESDNLTLSKGIYIIIGTNHKIKVIL